MIIYIVSTDPAGTYHLAGQTGVSERVHSSAADVEISGNANLQVVAKVRATHAQHIDRKNVSNTITFTTTRKFTDAQTAEEWALEAGAVYPLTGELHVNNYTMADAVVAPPVRRLNGATIHLTYTVQGGAITGA